MENQQKPTINIKEEFLKFLNHWRWFVVGVFITLACAFVYLRYATKTYQSSAKIIVKEDNSNDLSSQLSTFSDGGLFSSKNNIENEIEILKSRTLNEKVIDSLKTNTEVWAKGTFTNVYLYKDNPFVVLYESNKGESTFLSFELTFNETLFDIETNDDKITDLKFGQKIKLNKGTLQVFKKAVSDIKDHTFVINTNSILKESDRFKDIITVSQPSQRANVLEISVLHPNPELASDYINTLIYFYNKQAVEDKRFVSEHTSSFISNRLNIIAEELGDVEKNVEQYKSSNNIADIHSEVKSFIDNLSTYEKQYIENETRINVTKDIIGYVSRSKTDDLVPSGIASTDVAVESVINEINSLILEKQRLSISSTSENPNYISLETQIKSLKSNLLQSLRTQLSNLNIAKNDLKRQENDLQSRLNQVPTQEREFRVIDRQQKVKEALYLFLLQKREETNITLAAIESNAKIIDKAIPSEEPVSPKTMIVFLASLVLGVFLPFIALYIRDILDDKVKTRLDLENTSDVPFLGDVPSSLSSDQLMELESRSSAAEAIRIVRTNLEFMLSSTSKTKCKTIFTTSTLPGEGKTFICANLAATIALSNKKVLLIGMDLRNPKIKEYINVPTRGFTNFLIEGDKPIEEFIIKVPNYTHFDVLPSGIIPPNPVELLIDERVETTFEYLKSKYDYILVDTAPVAPVTDTLLISKFADLFIYVVRANKLEKKLLNIPMNLYKQNKLQRMAFLLNDTDTTKGYGYGYGYGVNMEDEKKPIWKRILGIK